jgi:hypothetical protein
MPVPVSPETRILEKMKEIAVAADVATAFELAGEFLIRHYRHRQAGKSERPGAALRYVSSEIDQDRGSFHTSSEVCWAMSVDIVVDTTLLAEKGHDEAAGDDNDATGWDRLTAIARWLAKLYVDMGSELRDLVDDVLYGGIDPNEDSQPDDGRLAITVVVLYRTLHADPLHLLSPEENA